MFEGPYVDISPNPWGGKVDESQATGADAEGLGRVLELLGSISSTCGGYSDEGGPILVEPYDGADSVEFMEGCC
jgi:hypothetical protein